MESFELFSELDLPRPLALALSQMEFYKPTEVQAASIPAALEGRDILGTAQTGTGKTAAFGVPLIAFLLEHPRRQALVLAPTRELAAQILSILKQMSKNTDLRGVLVVGGESFGRQAFDLKRGVNFIVATPGRLNDHLHEKTMGLKQLGILVMDEFDRMLDMGFAPQIKKIMRHVPRHRQTLLFSATLPNEVRLLARSFLHDPMRVEIGQSMQPVAKIVEETIETTPQEKDSVLLKEIEKRSGKILIFVRTQIRTERIANFLRHSGIRVVQLHGGRSQEQRKRSLARFKGGEARVMVATDLAGRGIDIDDVAHVINYDPPKSREDYIHRIGRTARFGKEGKALTLLAAHEVDGKEAVTGIKAQPRFVYRSPRRRR